MNKIYIIFILVEYPNYYIIHSPEKSGFNIRPLLTDYPFLGLG